MSGGDLCNYCQFKINSMLGDLTERYDNDEYLAQYPEAKAMLNIAMQDLKRASTIIQRVDWLMSCDDGIEAFRERILEDMGKTDE